MRTILICQPWARSHSWALILLLVVATALGGCAGVNRRVELPSADQFEREQLRFHSDFRLPRRHRLLDELTARRRDIAERLSLPMSDEPINVYVFDDENRFQRFLKRNHPLFPSRRAFFVKNDTNLRVYTHWGEHVGEDLRHEVTHGYLHSVVPGIPLWMDEGLAEFFELPRGSHGFHRQHIFHLTSNARKNRWRPSLARLESLTNASELSQQDYAESWLWIHFFLETRPELRTLLQERLAQIRTTGKAEPISKLLDELTNSPADDLIDHLAQLADSMNKEATRNR